MAVVVKDRLPQINALAKMTDEEAADEVLVLIRFMIATPGFDFNDSRWGATARAQFAIVVGDIRGGERLRIRDAS